MVEDVDFGFRDADDFDLQVVFAFDDDLVDRELEAFAFLLDLEEGFLSDNDSK